PTLSRPVSGAGAGCPEPSPHRLGRAGRYLGRLSGVGDPGGDAPEHRHPAGPAAAAGSRRRGASRRRRAPAAQPSRGAGPVRPYPAAGGGLGRRDSHGAARARRSLPLAGAVAGGAVPAVDAAPVAGAAGTRRHQGGTDRHVGGRATGPTVPASVAADLSRRRHSLSRRRRVTASAPWPGTGSGCRGPAQARAGGVVVVSGYLRAAAATAPPAGRSA